MPTTFKSWFFSVLLAFSPSELAAQQLDSPPAREHTIAADVEDVLAGVGFVCISPIRWNQTEWLAAGGLLAATGTTILLDDEARVVVGRRGPVGDRLNAVGNLYGQVPFAAAVTAGIYGVGLAFDDEWLRGTGVILVQTLLSAGMLNLALKTVVGRSRPYANRGNTDLHPWAWAEESYSFPSGHTVVAFSLSSVLASRLKTLWGSIGLYSVAAITGWSRVYSDDHWLSDVVFGAAVSTLVGAALVNRYESREGDRSRVQIIPTTKGIRISLLL